MEAVFKICTQSRLTNLSDGACIGTNPRQAGSIRIPAPAPSTTAPPLLSAFRGHIPHTIMGALGSTGVGRTTVGVGQWPGVTCVAYNYDNTCPRVAPCRMANTLAKLQSRAAPRRIILRGINLPPGGLTPLGGLTSLQGD